LEGYLCFAGYVEVNLILTVAAPWGGLKSIALGLRTSRWAGSQKKSRQRQTDIALARLWLQ